jgi:predicted RNA-binding Zn ribbon-like protein
MAVAWTPHRFSGGLLVLDTTNTVVLRDDPVRGFDRFADPSEIAPFAHAASVHRAAELGGMRLAVDDAERIAPGVIALREAADRLFRSTVLTGDVDAARLAPMVHACASVLDGKRAAFAPTGQASGAAVQVVPFEAALAWSALSLLSGRLDRVRICGNCGWLFFDESRNRSRIWCDMAVCGNRRKAARHYRRNRAKGEPTDV